MSLVTILRRWKTGKWVTFLFATIAGLPVGVRENIYSLNGFCMLHSILLPQWDLHSTYMFIAGKLLAWFYVCSLDFNGQMLRCTNKEVKF